MYMYITIMKLFDMTSTSILFYSNLLLYVYISNIKSIIKISIFISKKIQSIHTINNFFIRDNNNVQHR